MSSNLYTFLGRVSDSMLLVATMDNAYELEEYKQHAKKILKTITSASPARCTIDAGAYLYHYIIEAEVCYLCLAEKGYPKRLAFQYLEELHREFYKAHAQDVPRYSRPYAAVSFDPKMNRIRKEYLDPRTPRNMKKLNEAYSEIHNIMCQNIQDLLARGDKLDSVSNKSSYLLSESKKFEKNAKYINLQAMYKTWGPVAAVVLVVLIIIYLRFR